MKDILDFIRLSFELDLVQLEDFVEKHSRFFWNELKIQTCSFYKIFLYFENLINSYQN